MVQAVVVADVGVVVVILAITRLLKHLVVLLAEQAVLPQRELVPGNQLTLARRTPEALDVVDLRLRAHHEVVLTEGLLALVALGPEYPATDHNIRLALHNCWEIGKLKFYSKFTHHRLF